MIVNKELLNMEKQNTKAKKDIVLSLLLRISPIEKINGQTLNGNNA